MDAGQAQKMNALPTPAPKNVKAKRNREKPQRSIKLSWEAPAIPPTYYEVEAVPETGKRKKRNCEKSPMIFKRLKTSTKYKFIVVAVFGEARSKGCKSNEFQTAQKSGQPAPAMHMANISKSTVDNSQASISNILQSLHMHPDGFDEVQNIEFRTSTKGQGEHAYVAWDHPTFASQYDDYEIIQYHVEVKLNGNVTYGGHFEYSHEMRTAEFPVELGKTYTIRVTTRYEELDTERRFKSHTTQNGYTRPKPPKLTFSFDKLAWHSADMAERYSLVVYDKLTNEAVYTNEGDFREDNYPFRQIFKWGCEYVMSVTAYGKSERVTTATLKYVYGGIRLARMPRARCNALSTGEDAYSADITWHHPQVIDQTREKVNDNVVDHYEVDHYEVTCVALPCQKKKVKENRCTFDGLVPGTKTKFVIRTVFKRSMENSMVETNEITADARPVVPFTHLFVQPDKGDPETCLSIVWGRVPDAQRYRVRVESTNYLQEIMLENNEAIVKGLTPDTEYTVCVSAGNEAGFSSEIENKCTTGIAIPSSVRLRAKGSSTLVITFDKAGNEQNQFVASVHNADEGDIVVKKTTVDESPYTFAGLNGNTRYYVELIATKDGKLSRPVKSDEILTEPSSTSIKCLAASQKNPTTDFAVEWEQDSRCDRYDVEVTIGGEVERMIRVEDAESCTYRCLQAGGEYNVRVRAVNDAGYSLWTEPERVNLKKTCQLASSDLTVTLDEEKPWQIAHVSWQKPESVEFFRVYTDAKQIDQARTTGIFQPKQTETSFVFRDGSPDQSCKVYIECVYSDLEISQPTQVSFKMGKIREVLVDSISAHLDEENKNLTVRWDSPTGVDYFSFKLDVGVQGSTKYAAKYHIISENHFTWKYQGDVSKAEVYVHSVDSEKSSHRNANRPTKTFRFYPYFWANRPNCVTLVNGKCYADVHQPGTFDSLDSLVIHAEAESGSVVTPPNTELHCAFIRMEITGLLPAELYKMYGIGKLGEYSKKFYLGDFRAAPEKVRALMVKSRSSNGVEIKWDPCEIGPVDYVVHGRISAGHNVTYTAYTGDKTSTFINTSSATTHVVEVQARNKALDGRDNPGEWSDCLKFKSAPAQPGQPSITKYISSGCVEVTVQPAKLAEFYRFTVKIEDQVHVQEICDSNTTVLQGLNHGQEYSLLAEAGNKEYGITAYSEASEELLFMTRYNQEEVVAEVKRKSLLYFEPKQSESFITPTLISNANVNVSVQGFLRSVGCGDLGIIAGRKFSGKSVLCRIISAKVAKSDQTKIVFLFDGGKCGGGRRLSFSQYVKQYLSCKLGMRLRRHF